MQGKYEVKEIVGEGAYGIVMQCRNKETNEIVAIKKFKDLEEDLVQKSMLRELKVLKKLKHDNIVQLKECFKKKGQLYLVFEYVERNLLDLIDLHSQGLEPNIICKFIYQISKAIVYMHNNDLIHRDIKPENILINNEMNVKVCDFGFARTVPAKGAILTDYVATRWYRAPELLLGLNNYGKEIDLWAIGCLMGELIDSQPMFPGKDELTQLSLIQKLIGPFSSNQMEMFYSNPRFSGFKMDLCQKPETLERRYQGKISKLGILLMKSLLKLDPKERISGNDLLMHPYFEELRQDDVDLINLNNVNLGKKIVIKQKAIQELKEIDKNNNQMNLTNGKFFNITKNNNANNIISNTLNNNYNNENKPPTTVENNNILNVNVNVNVRYF